MLVARPRNHHTFSERSPVSGDLLRCWRAEHRGQVPFQFDSEDARLRRECDGVNQPSNAHSVTRYADETRSENLRGRYRRSLRYSPRRGEMLALAPSPLIAVSVDFAEAADRRFAFQGRQDPHAALGLVKSGYETRSRRDSEGRARTPD